jgi:hypothetical protein
MDITENGPAPQQAAGMISSSWARDDYTNGRRRYKLYAIHTPVQQASNDGINSVLLARPRMAGNPTVIGEVTIEVPNLEVAKILYAAMGEMLSKQPPEILQVKAVP